MPFTPPPGTGLENAPEVFTKTPTFNAGIATVSPAITTPSLPGSGTATTNTTTVDVAAYIQGGTITVLAVGGGTVGTSFTAGQFITAYVPASATVSLTYTGTPTWVWQAV